MAETQTYEGMFLMEAGQDFEQAAEPVRAVLERSEAEILACKPWDERKLAYPINGNRRGLYVLTYFRADPSRLTEIEHDAQLNGQILRLLVLRKEQLDEEEINAETPALASARRSAESSAKRGSGEGESRQGAPAGGQQSQDRKSEPKGDAAPSKGESQPGPSQQQPAPEGDGGESDGRTDDDSDTGSGTPDQT
ncbi:MAG: 30S ribosomal protein S6 [Planctomycetota bacterium]